MIKKKKKIIIILFISISVRILLKTLVDDVISKQSLEVDAVSGATVSSKCIIKAIENTLQSENK